VRDVNTGYSKALGEVTRKRRIFRVTVQMLQTEDGKGGITLEALELLNQRCSDTSHFPLLYSKTSSPLIVQ